MVELEIDGKKVEVLEGSMVMDAANKLGTYIPHFCYHKKLSIAANCRMCLVEVEKAPKPLPACATPVSPGMIVRTASEKAVKAQKGVMEFLLINHPLDCPICDQGGECQLQDLAVGYGKSTSRYEEEKRVVAPKDAGPLISMKEMNRCIHCTRCVRFGQEIAGVMEFGMLGRGEHAEITTFVGKTVNSELSGNMIDLCPVGALTSKPFRYSARTWELSRRKSVSPHDSVGANLIVQVKGGKVMRVLPLENDAVNECWISDKDRFSYEGLDSAERLTSPKIKQDGIWRDVDWQTALEYVAHGLGTIKHDHGADAIAALATPYSTLEELTLLQKVVRGLGSSNIDFRLRQTDFSLDRKITPWLGLPIVELSHLDRVLIVGSFLRKDHPLLASRLRHATGHGGKISVLHASDDDLLMPLAQKIVAAPSEWLGVLHQVVAAIAQQKSIAAPAGFEAIDIGDAAKLLAQNMLSGEAKAVFLGNAAAQHPQASKLHLAAQWIAAQTGARFGYLTEGGNTVGGYLANAIPGHAAVASHAAVDTTVDAAADATADAGIRAVSRPVSTGTGLFAQPRKAYVLLHAEPELDCADPQAAIAALSQADMVVVMSPFNNAAAAAYADVMLPVSPFSETSGTFVNAEGRAQSFNGTVRPLGDTRPAWKVLRVLGNLLGLANFDYETSEAIRAEVLGDPVDADALLARLNNVAADALPQVAASSATAAGTYERLADVSIYATDAIVRRAPSLQATVDGAAPQAWLPAALAAQLGVAAGDQVKVTQGQGSALLTAAIDQALPAGVVRVAAGHASTAALGAMFGAIAVEKV